MKTRRRNHVVALVLGLAVSGAAYGQAGDRIMVDGSTGVRPLVAALAKAHQAQNPGVEVEIGKGMGTEARIRALAEGKIDIAMASHGLNVEDITRQGMAVHEIAKVAVVFGINAGVPAAGLADGQICDIYSQKLRNWSELGSPDLAIAPLTRPDSEVDTEVVRAKIGCLKDLRMPESVAVMPKGGDMAKGLAATSGAIGMTTMTVVEQSGGRIKPVSLNGIAPSSENVKSGAYALTRDSFLVTQGTPSAAVSKFLAFVRSPAGEQIISANGAVPAK